MKNALTGIVLTLVMAANAVGQAKKPADISAVAAPVVSSRTDTQTHFLS